MIVFASILAGCAALWIGLRVMFPFVTGMTLIYEGFALAGGLVVGIPVAIFVPERAITRLSWPWRVFAGAALGPIALALVFLLLFAFQGNLKQFSLAHLDLGWPLSIIVSTAAFLTYAELLTRSAASHGHERL